MERKAVHLLSAMKTEEESSRPWEGLDFSSEKEQGMLRVFSTKCHRRGRVSGFDKFHLWLISNTVDFGRHTCCCCRHPPSCAPRTWLQHALGQRLPVEGVRGGVEQVPQNDGAVHDGAGGQPHGVSHQGVHQRVYRDRAEQLLTW